MDDRLIMKKILSIFCVTVIALILSPFIMNILTISFRLDTLFLFNGLSWRYVFLQLIILIILASFIIALDTWNVKRLINIILLISILLIFFSLDRMLLTWKPNRWKYDSELLYVQTPNVKDNWGKRFGYKPISINKFGFHDKNFSKNKKNNEYRIVILGDSITMGHGVTYNETFSKFLEKRLNSNVKENKKKFLVINAGVEGYSGYQEFIMMKRTYDFSPDMYILGFYLNDITEPSITDARFGGTGFDYHNIDQRQSSFNNLLATQTGAGRVISLIKLLRQDMDRRVLERQEHYSVNNFVKNFKNSQMQLLYKKYLKNLDEMVQFTKEKNIPFIVLLFPYREQVENEELQVVQNDLMNYLENKKIDYINFIAYWETTQQKNKKIFDNYFLDSWHYTPSGHNAIGNILHEFLVEKMNLGL